MIENGSVPEYDILVTNPPYSADHMERLLHFCHASQKPFFLLLPNYVYTKPYYNTGLDQSAADRPFYLVPLVRYWYWPPQWAAAEGTSRGREKTSPFLSFWYCGVPTHREQLIKWWGGQPQQYRHGLRLAINEATLPKDVRGEFDPNKKRPNPKQRKRFSKLQRESSKSL